MKYIADRKKSATVLFLLAFLSGALLGGGAALALGVLHMHRISLDHKAELEWIDAVHRVGLAMALEWLTLTNEVDQVSLKKFSEFFDPGLRWHYRIRYNERLDYFSLLPLDASRVPAEAVFSLSRVNNPHLQYVVPQVSGSISERAVLAGLEDLMRAVCSPAKHEILWGERRWAYLLCKCDDYIASGVLQAAGEYWVWRMQAHDFGSFDERRLEAFLKRLASGE